MLFSDLREITGKDIPITRTYFTALVLAVMMSFMLLPTYADNTSCERDAGEHIFTDEELAWEITPENAKFFTEEFVEVKKVENEIRASSGGAKAAAADTQTEYYIIETADGYMLTSPSGGSFSRTRYSTGNSNSHLNQKWIFDKGSDGYYTVYSKTDSSKCLTVNPSTKAVTLSAYTGSQYQKWKMYISSSGNALASAATDTAVKDYKLKISSTSCSVSNTSYTAVGFFTVSSYVPATALSHADFYLTPGQAKYVYPTKTPSNASGSSNNWLIWSVSPVNSMPAVVSSDGKVTAGTTPMTFSLSFTNKITRVSGSCFITITEIANGTYFLKNKQNSNYAKVKSGTMTNGQNVVQYDFDGDAPERWIFTLNTATGYYSIKSANSGSTSYYMAVSNDATTVGTPIVIRSATESTLTDGMKWKVAKTTSGAYKLCPKTGEANGYVLNTSTAAGTNNANLTQDTYVQNTSYRDEWLLIRIQYSATVYNYYDKGYYVRYGVSEATSISKINSYTDAISERYLELLGLAITAPTAAYYESSIDICKGTVNSSNINTLCSHTNPHTILFNSTNSLSNHFNNNTSPSGSNVITKAYWSGHRIKTYSNVGEYNRCYSSGTSIFMLERSSILVRDRDSKGILMHELNHQFGAPDHYHEILDEGTPNERCRGGELCSICGSNPRPSTCIMNQSRIDITDSSVICTRCKSDIRTHLMNHH